MTRDEAITKAEEALGFKTIQAGAQSIEARKFVDIAAALGLLTGAWLVIFGVLLIAIGWKLRGIIRDLEHEARGLRQEPRVG
mgnify:CR=1 FL=1